MVTELERAWCVGGLKVVSLCVCVHMHIHVNEQIVLRGEVVVK